MINASEISHYSYLAHEATLTLEQEVCRGRNVDVLSNNGDA